MIIIIVSENAIEDVPKKKRFEKPKKGFVMVPKEAFVVIKKKPHHAPKTHDAIFKTTEDHATRGVLVVPHKAIETCHTRL